MQRRRRVTLSLWRRRQASGARPPDAWHSTSARIGSCAAVHAGPEKGDIREIIITLDKPWRAHAAQAEAFLLAPWQSGENERARRRELLRRRNEEIKLNGGPRGEGPLWWGSQAPP